VAGRRGSGSRLHRLKLLLDTHAALWWLADDERLSDDARKAIARAELPLLSAGTLLEVAIKASLAKLEVDEGWAEELLREGFELLAITPAHGIALRDLPVVGGHRDPFDRLLVAQASVERVAIVTRDPRIVAHGYPTIW